MAERRTDQRPLGVSDERNYFQRLSQSLRSSLTSEGLPFPLIVRLAGGAYPTDVREALQSMVASGKVILDNGIYRLSTQRPARSFGRGLVEDRERNAPANNALVEVSLADPHPADYDWRFTPSALRNLAERMKPFVDGGAKIALLGTTTLFPQLASTDAAVTLFDRSPSLLRDLEAAGFTHGLVEHDLFDPIADAFGRFNIVVADPPWYPAFHRAFILRGTEILEEGGLLLLSVLPWLTRPSAVADRADILAFARECGLDLAEVAAGNLLYESPKFERVALAMHNIYCGAWRAGDLFVFRKVDQRSRMLDAPRPDDEPAWDEYRIGSRKIKLRLRPEAWSSGFRIEPAWESGRYFGTVSRRSPLRSKIDLWTSENLAYSVEGLGILRYALARLAAGDSRDSIARDASRAYSLTSEEALVLSKLLGEVTGKAAGWSQ